MIIKLQIKQAMYVVAVVIFTILLVINPTGALMSAKDAMALCGNSVIPALFPFFVCSQMLISLNVTNMLSRITTPIMKPIFGVSGGGALAFIMGLISGYPVGAKTVVSLVEVGECTKSEGEKLLAFCNNSGPLFILGAVGAGMLGNPRLGVIIYISHFLASVSVGISMRGIKCEDGWVNRRRIIRDKRGFGEMLSEAISTSAASVFTISGFVILFNILIKGIEGFGVVKGIEQIMMYLNLDYKMAQPLFFGIFETTNGCRSAAFNLLPNSYLLPVIISAIIGWSGISVHLQVLGIIKKSGLSPRLYIIGKMLMTIIAPIYTFILLKLMPQEIGVFNSSYNIITSAVPLSWQIPALSVIYVLLGVLLVIAMLGFLYLYNALIKKA